MRALFCGDRYWLRADIIHDVMASLPDPSLIIHGDCRGADKLAGKIAVEYFGFDVLPFPADWTRYGPAAGPIRNQQMLDEGKPDVVHAFHSDIKKSKGTADMVRKARKAGIEVHVHG